MTSKDKQRSDSPPDGPSKVSNTDLIQEDRFPPDEEAALLRTSNAQKTSANALFSTSRYSEAIGEYDKALSTCPNYLDYEAAVLRSNIAACHLKLADWKGAVDAATAALDALGRLQPPNTDQKAAEEGKEDGVVEIEGEGEAAERELERVRMDDRRKEDVRRIRGKALMRRAKGSSELGGWGNLQGAEEDYKELAKMEGLPVQDRRVVQKALAELPKRLEEAKQKEMGQMMGKLKELGNGFLKPFGLSTDSFNMVKDEKSGGYSMSFNQGE